MSTSALLLGGTVVDITSEQFPVHDSMEWLDVTSFDPVPAVGWSSDATGTLAAPVVPGLTLAQQAVAALNTGLAIVSTATPALNATYAVDVASQNDIVAVQSRINAGLGLPLGASTIPWIDMAGAVHEFTATQFTTFAEATSDYVFRLKMVANGVGDALPSQPVTIA